MGFPLLAHALCGLSALSALLVLSGGAAGAPQSAVVLTVGPPGSGAGFLSLQAAVDAAPPGATVQVAPGSYGPVLVQKPLNLLGAGSFGTFLQANGPPAPDGNTPAPPGSPALRIRNVPKGGVVRVVGLRLLPPPGPGTALEITQCAGEVQLVDVVFQLQGPVLLPSAAEPRAMAELRNNNLVSMDSCVFAASPLATQGTVAWHGAAGLFLDGGRLTLNRCQLVGSAGAGLLGGSQAGGAGPGLRVRGGQVDLSRTQIRGGDGAIAIFQALPGAPGLWAENAQLRLGGGPSGHFQGGRGKLVPTPDGALVSAGGSAIAATTTEGVYAPDLALLPGAGGNGVPAPAVAAGGTSELTLAPTPLPSAGITPAWVAAGGAVTVDIAGAPFSVAWPWLAVNPGPGVEVPGIAGTLWLAPLEATPLPTVFLDQTGRTEWTLSLPPAPALLGRFPAVQVLSVVGVSASFSAPALVAVQP